MENRGERETEGTTCSGRLMVIAERALIQNHRRKTTKNIVFFSVLRPPKTMETMIESDQGKSCPLLPIQTA